MAKKTKKRPSKQVFVPPVVVTQGKLIGYGRVSTEEQNLDLQVDALEKAGCLNIYTEKVSGAAKKRPQLNLAIKDLRPGDTLVVWLIDRLARSMAQFYVYLGRIAEAGTGFKSLTENFDLDTATGRLVPANSTRSRTETVHN